MKKDIKDVIAKALKSYRQQIVYKQDSVRASTQEQIKAFHNSSSKDSLLLSLKDEVLLIDEALKFVEYKPVDINKITWD